MRTPNTTILVSLAFTFAVALANASTSASAVTPANAATPAPLTLPGAETFVYSSANTDAQSLRLHVVKPAGWKTTDKRPALVFFFGGGWARGTPASSFSWAKLAATWGMVGIVPDYRTKERFNTTPLESVADARAAYAWIQTHAAELGIDPARVVVGGSSAGAHVALWTAITKAPGSPDIAPAQKPAALALLATPADLSDPRVALRYGPRIAEVSPLQHIDAKMPPIIMFHGADDTTVPYNTVVPLVEKLKATGNRCEFITVENAGHSFSTEKPEWKEKCRAMIKTFLIAQKILPPASQ